jgi:hypothetical protein
MEGRKARPRRGKQSCMTCRVVLFPVLAAVFEGASVAEAQTQVLRFRADFATRSMKVPTWHSASGEAEFTRAIATLGPDARLRM